MQGWHQKDIVQPSFPFHLFIDKPDGCVSHHWHDEIEIIYILEGSRNVGVNNQIYHLETGDILLIGSRDIHYIFPQPNLSKWMVIQFDSHLFDHYSMELSDKKYIKSLFINSKKHINNKLDINVHKELEKQILLLAEEYEQKKEGYHMALKARLYDLIVTLVRQVSIQDDSSLQKSKQTKKLESVDLVIQYIEEHYDEEISLEEIAKISNFSTFYFAHFFKEITGMTFGQYLNSYRIRKAEWYLTNRQEPISQIAFKVGFNSINTFNRTFKEENGCSPTQYRKAIFGE